MDGGGIEKRELSCTLGENVNGYNHYGERYGDSFKQLAKNYHACMLSCFSYV